MKIRTGIAAIAILAVTTMASSFAQSAGADTYKAKCAMCHGADGLATGPAGKSMKVPAFGASKMSDADMIAETKTGKGKMPAFAGKLTDAQIKDVITYVHTLQK
jgi:cytochrome c6